MEVTREQALALLQKYNQEPFHILHALTVEGVMRWFAQQEGEDADILLCPSIAAGNLLGKALYGLAGGQMAGVVLGASVPITINSRGATPEEKYSSILICSAMSPAGPSRS